MSCSGCGAGTGPGARFCSSCGAPVVGGPRAAEERKVVSVLFCDLVGSTELAGALDPELLRSVLLRYYDLMSAVVAGNGGVVEKFIGDAVMAVFGLIETGEDDARRAMSAALGMVEAAAGLDADLVAAHGVRLRVRIGVHTGEVVATPDPGDRQAFVSGEVVNTAARLEAAAPAGGVLVSASARSAAGVVATGESRWLALKGVAEPVEAYQLHEVPPPDPEVLRRFDVPFVGRERDLRLLDEAWAGGGLVTVVGEAGIGKTRLVTEWMARNGLAAGVVGRCRPGGEGGSLAALAECVAPLVGEAGGAEGAVALLRRGLLLDGTPAPSWEETATAVAGVLRAVGRPVVLVVDDWHWAEHTLVSVVAAVLEHVRGLPVLVVCLARPELADTRPGWGAAVPGARTAQVDPLPRADSELLAAHLAEIIAHDQATTDRLIDQAGGNPLYLEQLLAAVDQDGVGAEHLPLTLHALVASRIDRLSGDERAALRIGALVDPHGDGFGEDDVAALTDGRPPLLALVRRRMLERVTPGYRVVDGVTRQVAYSGLTKRRRGELHELFGDHLERRGAPAAVVGTHLAQACRYQADVGVRSARLRLRACGHLTDAGTEALRRLDLPRALALLDQAAALSEPGEPDRALCLERLGEVQLTLGQLDKARRTLASAVGEATAAGSASVAGHARLHLAAIRRDPAGLERVAGAQLAVFAAHGDDLGLARVLHVLAGAALRRGRHAEALTGLEDALAHSLAADAGREVANVLGAVGLALWHGPTPVDTAVERVRLLLNGSRDRVPVRATLGFALTMLHAVGGRREQAGRALAEVQEAMAAISYAESRFFRPFLGGLVAACAEDDRRARRLLREALGAARSLGTEPLVRQASLELARVHLDAGETTTAAGLLDGLTATDPADSAALDGLTARVAAERGEAGPAMALSARAVAAAERTDSPADQGRALLDQAHVDVALGRSEHARRTAALAAERFAAKGHVVGRARALRLAG